MERDTRDKRRLYYHFRTQETQKHNNQAKFIFKPDMTHGTRAK